MQAKQSALEVQLDEAREMYAAIQKAAGASGGGKGFVSRNCTITLHTFLTRLFLFSAIWWANRKIFSADYYLASNKRRYDHNKSFDEQFKI
jgi:hypothetical protein